MTSNDLSRLTRRQVLRLAGLGLLGWAVGCTPTAPPAAQVAPPPTAPLPTPTVPPLRAAAPPTVNAEATAVATKEPGGRLRPFVTPTAELYVQTKSGGFVPATDAGSWRLEVGGLVERPFSLSLDEIRALPAMEEMRTLECIGNPAGGDLIGNIVWQGTRLKPLLERAGLQSAADEIVMYAADDYHTAVPKDLLLRDDILLVYAMNGTELPKDHGYPLRISIPGRYGQKQPKWLTRLEAVRGPHLGYYEQQGWSNEAIIRPNSRIDYPVDYDATPQGELVVRGIGMAGEAGIESIEVSFDDGATWTPARLVRGPSNLVWTFWEARWAPEKPARYPLLARVSDRDGKTQKKPGASFSLLGPAFPDGTNEMHRITAYIVPASS
ncbi:MAG: molybdopterin-dependent oxidoreductase [Anaerolineae bacterium]|nr:molybdopterin-dependent oxidoreductase [Anaerolineae bacterium]